MRAATTTADSYGRFSGFNTQFSFRCALNRELGRSVQVVSSGKVELASGSLPSELDGMKTDYSSASFEEPSLFVGQSWSRFLRGLTSPQQQAILKAASLCRYPIDSVVLNQGDLADRFMLLRTGSARIFFVTQGGRKVMLRWLSPGEILGGTALLAQPCSYIVSTEMMKNSSAFVWRRDTIRKFATQHPVLLDNALPFAWDYMTWFVAAHTALIANTARERLAQVITSLAQGLGHKTHSGIRLEVTNEQLANTANITPFTTSRLLSEWQRSGAIRKARGMLVILSPDQLLK
jgi:CRP-like cAMP-binding protein